MRTPTAKCPSSSRQIRPPFSPPPFSPPPFPVLLPHPRVGGCCSLCSCLDKKATLLSLTSFWAVNTRLLICIWRRKKRRGGRKEKHRVTHCLTSRLPGGHVQATAENSNCASFHRPPQLHPPLHHTSCCSGPAQPGAHVLVLEGPAQRLQLSHHPSSTDGLRRG